MPADPGTPGWVLDLAQFILASRYRRLQEEMRNRDEDIKRLFELRRSQLDSLLVSLVTGDAPPYSPPVKRHWWNRRKGE
jgi:hypothetical protein